VNAEIISVGTELMMGELVDSNSAFIASELSKIGIQVNWVTKVADDLDQLQEIITSAWERSEITITTGGLGPTSDDLTRESISKVLGETMDIDVDLKEDLKKRFKDMGSSMPKTNIKQATLIDSANSIPNTFGTAPGWWVEKKGHVIIALPGPPNELQPMWKDHVVPKLILMNAEIRIITRNIKTFGISEGKLDEMLSPLFESTNPKLGIYSKRDGIHLRAISTAHSETEALKLVETMEKDIRAKVGNENIWGIDDDTPESKVVSILRENNLTLAVMESFTCGLIVSKLNEESGASDYFLGGLVAPQRNITTNFLNKSAITNRDMVSGVMAMEMAKSIRSLFGADIGLAITDSELDTHNMTSGVGTTYIGFSCKDRENFKTSEHRNRRLRTKNRAATQGLIELLRFLQ